jgi:hypothetical protein
VLIFAFMLIIDSVVQTSVALIRHSQGRLVASCLFY